MTHAHTLPAIHKRRGAHTLKDGFYVVPAEKRQRKCELFRENWTAGVKLRRNAKGQGQRNVRDSQECGRKRKVFTALFVIHGLLYRGGEWADLNGASGSIFLGKITTTGRECVNKKQMFHKTVASFSWRLNDSKPVGAWFCMCVRVCVWVRDVLLPFSIHTRLT